MSFLIIVVIIAFLLLTIKFHFIRLIWIPTLTGFLAIFLPIATVAKENLILKMLERSSSNPYGTDLAGLELIFNNTYRSILGFFRPGDFGPYTAGPHISGTLVDNVTAILLIIGFFIAIIRFKESIYTFLLLWFFLSLLVVGGLSQYAWTNVSRLYYLLPIIAIFAGLGFEKIFNIIKIYLTFNKMQGVVILVFGILILLLNLYHFYILTPLKKPMTPEALTVREIRFGRCSKFNLSNIAVVTPLGKQSSIAYAFDSYLLQIPNHYSYSELTKLKNEQINYNCIIFTNPNDPELLAFIESFSNSPQYKLIKETDQSKTTTIFVVTI